jgi:hypothetical protein
MRLRERHVAGGAIVLASAVVSVTAFDRLPETLVTHWGLRPRRYDGTTRRLQPIARLARREGPIVPGSHSIGSDGHAVERSPATTSNAIATTDAA